MTLVAGGVGTTGGSITATGTIDIDVGTGNNQILQLNGSSQIPAVDGSLLTFVNAASIRGVNLSTTAPTPGQILTYNGSAWEAAAAPTSGINALSGDVTASGTGSVTATIRNDRITTAMIQSAGGGVNRLLITDSTTGANVTFADGCAQDEILKWNTTLGWDCSTDGNGGAVTLVVAGSGLVSGSISGTGTLAVDVGTGSNQIVQLNGSGQLPAVDGSLLTDLNLAAVTAGTLDVDSGGTGATSLTDNRLLLGNGTAAIGVLAAGTAGQLLQSGGASDPAWSTATFPTGAATQYDFLYASAANTWSSFATANTGAMVTSSAGVPSWASGAVANRLLRTDGTTISFAQVNPTTDIAQGTGAVTIESVNAGTSTFGNATGAATTVVRSGTGGVDITSTGTNINAVDITATGAGGGVTIASNASGAFAMNGGTGANSIITSTRVAAGGLTLRTTGGGAATTLLTSNGTSAAAVNITATGAGGGITLTPNATGHTIISAGRLSVGAGNTPAYTLDVAGSGQFTGNVHALAFFYTSDGRLKENFTPSPGLEAINQLNGYRFNWKKDQSPEIGLIAQEVEKVFPELVTTKADGYKAVKYGNLVAPLIQSTKELYGMCKANESQWRALASVVDNNARVTDARINSLQDQVNQLKEENRALQMQVREIKSLLLNK